jgi:hypothetical protein
MYKGSQFIVYVMQKVMNIRFSLLDICTVIWTILVYTFAIATLSRCGLLHVRVFSLGTLITVDMGLFIIMYWYCSKVRKIRRCWYEGGILFRIVLAVIEIVALSDALHRGWESSLIPIVQSPVVEWLNAGTCVGIVPTLVLRRNEMTVSLMWLRYGSLGMCVMWFLLGCGKLAS